MCENSEVSQDRKKFLSVCYDKWKKITDPEESLRCFLLIQNTIVRLQNEAENDGDVAVWSEVSERREDSLPFGMNSDAELSYCIVEDEKDSLSKRSFDEMSEEEFHNVWDKMTAASESVDYEERWNILEEIIAPKKRKKENGKD